jgi:uncharacterized protein YndB with AHSA1/START domain
MPGFTLTAATRAPVEEVWKLVFDPTRFPEWWAGIETVRVDTPGEYTMWPDGYPDFPMGQQLEVTPAGVTISCLVSDLVFRWTLTDGPGSGTTIAVDVEIPEKEAHRLETQERLVEHSLVRLGALALGVSQR